jgi:ParB family chromosome partitioning protein
MEKVILGNDVKEVALSDLVIGFGQVRTVDVGRDIHELAESIKKIGLLEPIIICLSEEEGKYEIIAGQRRYLAHKEIGVETIKAIVIEDKLDELDAKIISLTENWNRRDLSSKDERDACLILWRRYNNVDLIIEDTGLPASKVRKYLRFNSLVAPLKALVDRDEVTLEAAYTAQKALEVTGDVDEEEVVGVAKELQGMSTPQRKKVTKKRKESPEKPMGAIIEEAKSGEKLIQVAVTLGEASHKGLQKYAQSEGTNQNSACGELIEEGLVNKGFLESE